MEPDPLERVQVKLAYLDKHLAELDQVVRDVADDVAALRRDLAAMQARLADDQLAGTGPEKPPHY